MTYDLYPAVDETYNFPPEVRVALSKSAELRNGIVPMTTVQRNNLTGVDLWDGRLISNTDENTIQFYDLATATWQNKIVTDHGALSGLGDDDHTQYVRVDRGRNAVPLRTARTGKDSNGVFTTVSYYRVGGNLAIRSVLSGGTSPQYTTRTVTEYGLDGTTAIDTTAYTLAYDAAGDFITETVA
jgi:hypothetical protein